MNIYDTDLGNILKQMSLIFYNKCTHVTHVYLLSHSSSTKHLWCPILLLLVLDGWLLQCFSPYCYHAVERDD